MAHNLFLDIGPLILSDGEDVTPLTSPAPSDESLLLQEIDQKPRKIVYPDSPQPLAGHRPMRVALVQTACGLKSPSGGYRGNYVTLLALQKYGHTTMQTCWAHPKEITTAIAELKYAGKYDADTFAETFKHGTVTMLKENLEEVDVQYWRFTDAQGILCVALDADVMLKTFENKLQQAAAKIMIETEETPARAVPYAQWLMKNFLDFKPTHILFNDAFASIVTNTMPVEFKAKVSRVEICHTFEQIPAGPYAGGVAGSANCPAEIELINACEGIVTVSKAMHKYAEEKAGLKTEMIPNHAWCYMDRDTSDWPRYRFNFKKQTVVMINPAGVKGYKIFLAMARENVRREAESDWNTLLAQPVYNFVAYMAWGTKPDMVAEMQALGVDVRDSVSDMEPVWDETSVLVFPSVWQEAWGIAATEAQLRGIPVIASDVGALPEAKRYVGPFVKVNAVDPKKKQADGGYIIPENDIEAWMRELDGLLTNKDKYEAISHMAFFTTRQWVKNFDIRAMERFLLKIVK